MAPLGLPGVWVLNGAGPELAQSTRWVARSNSWALTPPFSTQTPACSSRSRPPVHHHRPDHSSGLAKYSNLMTKNQSIELSLRQPFLTQRRQVRVTRGPGEHRVGRVCLNTPLLAPCPGKQGASCLSAMLVDPPDRPREFWPRPGQGASNGKPRRGRVMRTRPTRCSPGPAQET